MKIHARSQTVEQVEKLLCRWRVLAELKHIYIDQPARIFSFLEVQRRAAQNANGITIAAIDHATPIPDKTGPVPAHRAD